MRQPEANAILPRCLQFQEGCQSKVNQLGLVLGGGGVRCLSHLGVAQCLLDEGLRPDHITCSSTGTLVGILLAAEIPPMEIRRALDSYRVRWGWFWPTLRSGGLFNQQNFLRILDYFSIPDRLEDLAIPVQVMVTDLVNAQSVALSEGNTRLLTLASCALPGVYAPIRHQGTILGDGGVTNNVPADVCRAAVGEKGIVVCSSLEMDTSMPPEEIRSFLQVVYRSIYLPIVNERYRNFRRHADVLIEPFRNCPLCFSQWREILRFHNRRAMEEHFRAGYREMERELPALRRLLQAESSAGREPRRSYQD